MKVGDLARVTMTSLLGRKGDVVLILEVEEYHPRPYVVLHQRTGQKRRHSANFLEKIQ